MVDARQYFLRKWRNCTCTGYNDHEFKELKDGRIVKVISCYECGRIKKRIYYKKEKPCKP